MSTDNPRHACKTTFRNPPLRKPLVIVENDVGVITGA
jgi:hypothetical protein